MILIPILALIIGIALPLVFKVGPLQGWAGQYLAVSCLAGIDTVCGGMRTGFEQKFRTDVFITGFVVNVTIAFGLAWLGDRIGINLFLVAALVLGQRIFNNLSIIRRQLLTKWQSDKERRKLAQEQAAIQAKAQSQTQANQ